MQALVLVEVRAKLPDLGVFLMPYYKQGSQVAIQDHPVPVVGDDDILVKNIAVAQNPTDWKCKPVLWSPSGTPLNNDTLVLREQSLTRADATPALSSDATGPGMSCVSARTSPPPRLATTSPGL